MNEAPDRSSPPPVPPASVEASESSASPGGGPTGLAAVARGTGWAALGGLVFGVAYAAFVVAAIEVDRAPNALMIQTYVGLVCAAVAAVVGVVVVGAAAWRGKLEDPLAPAALATGASAPPLLLLLVAAGLRAKVTGVVPIGGLVVVLLGSAALNVGGRRVARALLDRLGAGRTIALGLGAPVLIALVASTASSFGTQVAAETAAAGAPTGAPARRVLWFSVDGGSLRSLQLAMDRDRAAMPTLRRLVNEGAHGVMVSEEPFISPALLMTQATGRPRSEHGVEAFLDLLVPGLDPLPLAGNPSAALGPLDLFYVVILSGYHAGLAEAIPPSAAQRRGKAIWNVLDERGLEAAMVAFCATWPADPLEHGRMVSNRFGYNELETFYAHRALPGATHPAELAAELEPLTIPPEVTPEDLLAMTAWNEDDVATIRSHVPNPVDADFRTLLKMSINWDDANLAILERLIATSGEEPPALATVHLSSLDAACHAFWIHAFPGDVEPAPPADEIARYGPVIPGVWERLDAALARLIAAMGPDTVVLVTSDHGFRAETSLLGVGAHALDGMFVIAGPGVARGVREEISIYDVYPMLLHLFGLEAPEGLRGSLPEKVFVADSEGGGG